MSIKRIFCLVLILLFLLVSACDGGSAENSTSSGTVSQADSTVTKLSLFYDSNDSLDPYKAKSRFNRQLSSLMFDPLVKLDSAFQPQFVLAKDITFNGKECTITLKSVSFTDGSTVTADDVVFSLEKALKSKYTVYSRQLSSIKSYKADGADKVVITLTKADPYFANLLDFPIIKKDSDTRQDENQIELPPIGFGRYVFDAKEKLLSVNAQYFGGAPTVTQIKLVNAPDDEVTKYNLEVNNVDAYYTELSDGVIPPMAGTVEKVSLNNLLFLGVNLSNRHLRKHQLRYAIASAIDRTALCNDAYYNYATPAVGLFNSVWEDAGKLQNLPETANLQNVVANLNEIGYNSKDDEGFFTDIDKKPIKFKLIVSEENAARLKCAKLLCEQLNKIGFKTELSVLSWEKYTEALTYGNFDLYLAEVKLNNNMDVSELITSNGSLSYGIPELTSTNADSKPSDTKDNKEYTDNTDKDDEQSPSVSNSSVPLIDSAVTAFYKGELSLFDIINAFNAEMPIIPLCHRCGLTVYNSQIKIVNMSTVSDAYFGITNKLTNQ